MQDNLTYYVDESKKTIVCIAKDCEFDFLNEILRSFSSCKMEERIIICNFLEQFKFDCMLNYKYTGKARCSKDDVFDIEKGKKIARQKMRIKYNRDKLKIYRKMYSHFKMIQDDLLKNIQFCLLNIEKHVEAYNKYIDE